MNLGRIGSVTRLGATTAPSASALASQVAAIFQKYFGRTPASAGLAFWENAVTSGAVTDANLPLAIVQSAAPTDKAYFTAKFPTLAQQVYNAPPASPVTTSAPTATATQQQQTTSTATSTGMDTNTMLMLAAGAFALWYFMRKA
jgi:hypothetical protein